ncbi:MAG: hypothetical protein DMD65_10605 [Gemmatimonadetes bacterium]|nr:MAG: hypothetical protein DMD65_10605 [Gemmatimonadota bacterium]
MCRPRRRGLRREALPPPAPGGLHGCGGARARDASGRAARAAPAARVARARRHEGLSGRGVPHSGIGAARHGAGHLLRLEHQRQPDGEGQQRLHQPGAAGWSGREPQVHRGRPHRGHPPRAEGHGAERGHAVGGRHRRGPRVQCEDRGPRVFLNDVAVAPTGALYITDTGIKFDDVGNVLHPGPDRIFRIGPDRAVTVALKGDTLGRPKGIAVDPVGKRFVIVQFGGRAVLGWKPEDKAPKVIARGAGGFDGVVVARGRILVSSWNDSTVASYETGQEVKVVTGVPGAADIGYDARRNRLLVPILPANRVEVWQLP